MVPLSIFTLSHDKEPNLCELATGKKGKQKLACDYADSDVFDRARFMLGTTTLSGMTAVKFDHTYFDLVAKENKPLAWHNPYKTRGGFRVSICRTAGLAQTPCTSLRYAPMSATATSDRGRRTTACN